MRLLKYLSPAFCWACFFVLGAELFLQSSIHLQCWLTRNNTPGVLSTYLYNSYHVRQKGQDIKLLIVGDSVSMMSVDAHQLAQELGLQPQEVFNFSHGGAGPSSHLHNFTKLQNCLPNLRSIILFVQYMRLNQVLSNAQTLAEDLIQVNDQPLRQVWDTTSLNALIHNYSLVFQLAPLIIWQTPTLPFPGLRSRTGGGTTMHDIIPGTPVLPKPNPFQANPPVITDFKKLLIMLKGAGLTVREYVTPYHPEYQKEWQGGEEDRFGRQFFRKLRDAGLLEFYPDAFQGLEEKLQPYYVDLYHITPSGAKIFTKELARHLKENPMPGIKSEKISDKQ